MKRALLLMAVSVLALSFPTTASACFETCDGVWAPCYYYEYAYSYCHESGNICWFSPCRTSTTENPELLSTKWKIASVEIERIGPADQRPSEIRIAANTDPESPKAELPSLK
jgi:hypothetical protein